MEEEKLLRILKFIIALIIFLAQICAANDDLKWADDLSNNGIDSVWEHLSAKFNEQEKFEGKNDYPTHSTSKLYAFVSSSMPIPLLKSYAKEALKYDAILVFKGLPEGSFKELAELMVQLKDDEYYASEYHASEDNIVSAVIDDEAYGRFNVNSVPTIILTQEPAYHPNQTPLVIFDKITGNVGIKYALEQFKNSGDLKEEAAKCLEGIHND